MNALFADSLVVFHFAFILFVILGGLLIFKWPRLAYLHIPAVVWGGLIEWQGWLCPLTPLENRFRQAAGRGAYQEGFIEHHLMPIIYPEALTREDQLFLALAVLMLNGALYTWALLRRFRS